MAFKMKYISGTPFHFHGGDPADHTSSAGEKKVSSKVTRQRITKPSGQTGTLVTFEDKYKTPGGEVKRTVEGDKAYAAKNKEQRKVQDKKYLAKNRSESKERFIADPVTIKPKGLATMPTAKIKPSIDVSKDIFNKEFDKPESEANYKLRQNLYKRKYEDADRGSMSNTEKIAQNTYSKLRKTEQQRSDASKAAKKQKAKYKLKKALTIDLSRKGAKKGSMRGKAGCPAGKC
tara:strand:+ start:3568 stop:4263 length:696 start_codon:yes stop_codon:yes gene_type:complete